MGEKDIQNLMELVESKIQAGVTAEKALQSFMRAGILDANGDFTPPYQEMLAGLNLE